MHGVVRQTRDATLKSLAWTARHGVYHLAGFFIGIVGVNLAMVIAKTFGSSSRKPSRRRTMPGLCLVCIRQGHHVNFRPSKGCLRMLLQILLSSNCLLIHQ